MKYKNIAIALASLLSTSSNAALIDNGVYTTDTASGLDWLDLTQSTGRDYNYISSQFGEGGRYEGWRYASIDEVVILINNAGGNGVYTGYSTENNGVVRPLLNLWGNTFNQGDSLVMTGTPYSWSNQTGVRLTDLSSSSNYLTHDYIRINIGYPRENLPQYPMIGSALVRTASPVPLPPAIWLFGFGLLGIISLTKQKSFVRA